MRSLTYCLVAAAVAWVVADPARAQQDKDRPLPAGKMVSSNGDVEIDGKTLDQWIKYAKHPDPADRETAMNHIALFGAEAKKKALPVIIERLNRKNEDAAVSSAAIVALQKICINLDPSEVTKGEFDKLVRGLTFNLQSGIAYSRAQAAYALGSIGPAARDVSILPLADAVAPKESYRDVSYQIRLAAAAAIGRVGYKEGDPDMRAVAALWRALQDSSAAVRLQALSSLSILGLPKSREAKLRQKQHLDMLVSKEQNKVVQIWAHMLLVQTCVDLQSPKAVAHVETIVRYLQKEIDPENRAHAVSALGKLGEHAKDRIPLLIKLGLEDPQPVVAATTVESLGRLKKYVTEDDLKSMVKLLDPKIMPETRAAGAQALGAVEAVSRIPLLTDLLKDDEDPVANAAAGALGQMKERLTKKEIDIVVGLLRNTNEKVTVRCRAAQALGLFSQKARIPDLLDALKDKESAVAAASVSALAAMQKELTAEHVKGIAALLKDKTKAPETRGYAAQALGALGEKARPHLPELIDGLKDKEPIVIQSCVLALAQMGKDAKGAVDDLKELQKHRDPLIRDAARRAIDIIEGKKSQEK